MFGNPPSNHPLHPSVVVILHERLNVRSCFFLLYTVSCCLEKKNPSETLANSLIGVAFDVKCLFTGMQCIWLFSPNPPTVLSDSFVHWTNLSKDKAAHSCHKLTWVKKSPFHSSMTNLLKFYRFLYELK